MPPRRPATKSAPEIVVVSRPIAKLKPDPQNPRRHSKTQIRQIAGSIETFGFNVPILVDAKNQIIAGHGRMLACQFLGWTEVPTITLEHLSDVQRRAFVIADNRLTENATWDDRLLGEQFKALAEMNLDFDLELTGFAMAEIDLRIASLSDGDTSIEDDPADELPASGPAVSKLGDTWLLGRHRIHCGNALEVVPYSELMNGALAAMVFADLPYNVPISGHASGLGKHRHQDFAMASGEMSESEFTAFLTTAGQRMVQHSRNGSIHMLCMDWRHLYELLAAGRATYTELKNICVWVKDNAGMGSFYRSRHELVAIFKSGKASHRNNIQLGKHGRYRSNVWEYPGANTLSRTGKEGDLLALHPTVKPVRLVSDAILDCSARGDIILDPFLGSGTTVLAAERTGRVAYGLELEPGYVDTAIRRWQVLTGQKAKHARSHRLFDQGAAEPKIVRTVW